MISITIPVLPFVLLPLYLAIGIVFASRLAISGQSFFIITILWPLMALLALLSPIINWYANRGIR